MFPSHGAVMGRRASLVSPLLVAALLVRVEAGEMVSVYQTTTLPSSAGILNMTSPSLCGCRVRCLTVPYCTAVTAHKNVFGAITCVLTNATQPEKLFVAHDTAVSFVKGLEAGGGSNGITGGISSGAAGNSGTYFISSAVSNDGTHVETYCSNEGGVPASISDAQSLADLKAYDIKDGITDINVDGIWVFMRWSSLRTTRFFYNNLTVSSTTSGVTQDYSGTGDCLRLKVNDVLASVECAYMNGNLRYACFKAATASTLTATTMSSIIG